MEKNISKEWCMHMSQLEGDAEIGVGRLAIDPAFDAENSLGADREVEWLNIAFGRLINLMRRQRGIGLEKLAEDADVDMMELVEIENNTRHKPALRTTYQLANYFNMPRSSFLQVAGLTARKDSQLLNETVRFAARAEPMAKLTPEESAALETFVAILSEQSK